ncbi:MAG: methionine--tRNA ligase [Acholeplasmataceae bacterium]|jgi:methionyl-tRNA synthetase|nr:methionine--tRNA ligase [Acholeplasmataceae bacterium]
MKKPFYITTSIVYASNIPHVGNVYEIILADSIARFKRLDGYDVFFQTGTDEHGLKIETTAKKLGRSVVDHVDYITAEIKRIYASLDIAYDQFVRTTDQRHKIVVEKIFNRLLAQNEIYLGNYRGWYSVSDEAYIFDKEYIEKGIGPSGDKLILMEEETYFFNLHKYQERLLKHIEENDNFILPETRKNEMVNTFLQQPLHDLSITRTTLDWGIPVLGGKHTIYVWIDALTNYISGFDLDENLTSPMFKKYWPCNIHLIGKDILRFHTIYWPIMLMALNLELPKTIFAHPWILIDKNKMSKSIGNTIYTDEMLKHFDKDTIRYYVLHEIPYQTDGNLTYELLIERNNADLANTLGNLVNRTIGMVNKYRTGIVKKAFTNKDYQINLRQESVNLLPKIREKMAEYRVGDALEEVMKLLRSANKFIDLTEPWNLYRNEKTQKELDGVLYELIETIRFAAVLLQAFIPATALKIFAQLNCDLQTFKSLEEFGGYPDNTVLNKPEVLFERFDLKKKMTEILEEKND